LSETFKQTDGWTGITQTKEDEDVRHSISSDAMSEFLFILFYLRFLEGGRRGKEISDRHFQHLAKYSTKYHD